MNEKKAKQLRRIAKLVTENHDIPWFAGYNWTAVPCRDARRQAWQIKLTPNSGKAFYRHLKRMDK